jgi:hypothetical protein
VQHPAGMVLADRAAERARSSSCCSKGIEIKGLNINDQRPSNPGCGNICVVLCLNLSRLELRQMIIFSTFLLLDRFSFGGKSLPSSHLHFFLGYLVFLRSWTLLKTCHEDHYSQTVHSVC